MNGSVKKLLDESLNIRNSFSPASVNIFTYFVVIAVVGSGFLQIPFFYKDFRPASYIDTLFTTVSALCVTGLCPMDIERFNIAGLSFLMLIIELGGLGLIAFFTIYLALPARHLSLVSRQVVKDFFVADVETDHRSIVKRIVVYSLAIQVLGGIVLALILGDCGEGNCAFFGFFLSVSAFCNAGFAPWGDSLHHLSGNAPFVSVIMFLIVFGGLGFTVMQDVISFCSTRIRRKITGKGKMHNISLHSKIVFLMTVILIVVPSAVYLVLEWDGAFSGMGVRTKMLNALFQSVTCRTAGFELVGEGSFSPAGTFITEILMAIGGNPGSMAGGIKTTTIFLVMCQAFRTSSDLRYLSIFHRDVSYDDTDKASAVFVKAMIFISVILFALLLSERSLISAGVMSAGDLSFEAISAIGTAGLTRGITSSLSPLGKLILIVAMYGGRTGVMTLSLSIPMRSQYVKRFVDYPREEILVG